MYSQSFKYVRVASLSEAAAALSHYGEGAHLLAGGQSLIPLLKFRLAAPDVLIDLGQVPCAPISISDRSVTIPALTVHRSVYANQEVTRRFDVIRDAIPEIADAQVRNRGTIGGSLAEADPAGDWGPVVLALSAQIHTRSVSGQRTLPACEFFRGMYGNALAHGEIITAVELPLPAAGSGGVYLKVKRRAGAYAVASVAVQLTVRNGKCTAAGIACGAVHETPLRLAKAEELLRGQALSDELIDEAAEVLRRAIQPMSDNRGSEEYKRHLCTVLFKRGVGIACRRALGEEVAASVFHG